MDILAVISGESVFMLVVTIIVGGLVYWLLDWALTALAIPEPFNKIAHVVLILAVVVFLMNALFGLAGHAFVKW